MPKGYDMNSERLEKQGTNEDFLILIVDDVPKNLQVLGNILSQQNYRIAAATSGVQVFSMIDEICPDLILLDIAMPEMDGYQVCKKLKEQPDFLDIPIIFLTARSETEDIVKGFAAGAIDYVTKPFHSVELLARVRTHLELKRSRESLKLAYQKLNDANLKIREENEKLVEAQRKLELAAKTDALTRISNRRDMSEKIAYENSRTERSGKPFTIVLSDIDNFKTVNDTFGHDCGDHVLVSIAGLIKSNLRKQDHIGRWGGEEFLMLLPETDLEGGRIISEKIRNAVAQSVFEYNGERFSVTMTFGVTVCMGQDKTCRQYLKKADAAMYKGKKKGKNCVMLANNDLENVVAFCQLKKEM